ncbi:MAG: hypothetical protein GWN01_13025 [Nitrosopumilaceae archaeon]|nr:hypothetical protein [Nitrosopumilaceae archaeon]NIU01786.1 hypothetical protein [Nitrosopumilaceae archaeon]NIU88186.1 hypothetical protein [Nitrosopumilaceae archaeon]NIV66509.1 hypothetical protein [Nitrosopumilaceae archaeon]NIX62388.1 hypothetical protein [Nitrosopumilaceae archaeon]
MTHEESEIIGKKVKDMYGTFMGKVVGTMTDIDGSIQTVGVDCGTEGLKQIPYEQLVVQGDVVIYIPKWRLDSQRLLREKGLTLRRLKALIDIVSENDEMKDDAEIIHEKYKSKLLSLEESEQEIKTKLEGRLNELNEQMKTTKMLLFDAKVQYKSNEISESTFETVKTQTTAFIERLTHESAEISNVQRRISDLDLEVQETKSPSKQLQESAVTYLDNAQTESEVQSKLPEVPKNDSVTETKESTSEGDQSDTKSEQDTSQEKSDESDWLRRMEAQ